MTTPPWRIVVRALLLTGLCAIASLAPLHAQDASSKKGIGLVVETPGFAEKLATLRVSWVYTWGADIPQKMPGGVTFIPMVWGWRNGPEQDAFFRRLTADGKAGKFDTLLGFNEPDNKDQSRIPVETALDKWPQLAATGLRLGSPAAVHPDNDWMTAFMKGAAERKLRVDFITVHWYGGADEAAGFLAMLDRIHTLYNRPVWITEFAPADWKANAAHPNRYTTAQVVAFIHAVLPELNKRPYIERYAWFTGDPKDANLGVSTLFNADGTLTDAGRAYAGY